MRLTGKRAIVTGAASGFGAGIARRFAEEGAQVMVADIAAGPAEGIARRIGAIAHDVDVADRASVERMAEAATERILAVSLDEEGERALSAFRWGFLPRWAKGPRDGPPLINARSETIAEKPAFKSSFRSRRCLVPADGFYEWRALSKTGPKGKPVKQPHWIRPADGEPLVFGGVWRSWRGPDGEETPSLAIVTTAANESMSALHDRLPLRLAPEDFSTWLEGDEEEAASLMRAPAEAYYAHHPVSPRINRGGREAPDDPALIEPFEETEKADDNEGGSQPSLF